VDPGQIEDRDYPDLSAIRTDSDGADAGEASTAPNPRWKVEPAWKPTIWS
jgi:hypothetical protein